VLRRTDSETDATCRTVLTFCQEHFVQGTRGRCSGVAYLFLCDSRLTLTFCVGRTRRCCENVYTL